MEYKPHCSEEQSCVVLTNGHSNLRHADLVVLFDGQSYFTKGNAAPSGSATSNPFNVMETMV